MLFHLTSHAEIYLPCISSTNRVKRSMMADGWFCSVVNLEFFVSWASGLRGDRPAGGQTGVSSMFLCQREQSAVYLSRGPALIWLHSYSNPPARAADGTGLCPSNVSACFTGLSHISAPDICIYSPSLLCLLLPLGQVSLWCIPWSMIHSVLLALDLCTHCNIRNLWPTVHKNNSFIW